MPDFWTEFIALRCSNVEAAKQWWTDTFKCKQAKLPDWDDPRPSDIALTLPGEKQPTILLADRAEMTAEEQPAHQILFCTKLAKAYDYFREKGILVGPIQDGGGTEFFEIRDPDGNFIEICETP